MSETISIQQPVGRFAPRNILRSLIGLALAIVIIFLLWSRIRPYSFHGMVMQSPMPATDFTLTGQNGQPVSLGDFEGKIVLLYFGYTTCPDVCPTTLADLHVAREALGRRAEDVQVLMITVDPERDTQQVMADYMSHFDSSFIGLTGTPEQIAEVATYYGIFYEKQEGDSALGYLVDHTATVMAIDRDGFLRVVFPFGIGAQDITADLEYLLSR
ncbi:MAG TPA: SCO family protein [Anaerolineales bacterium]|nr:SCO family protein [Anaerolineales bacterium]